MSIYFWANSEHCGGCIKASKFESEQDQNNKNSRLSKNVFYIPVAVIFLHVTHSVTVSLSFSAFVVVVVVVVVCLFLLFHFMCTFKYQISGYKHFFTRNILLHSVQPLIVELRSHRKGQARGLFTEPHQCLCPIAANHACFTAECFAD